jgi:integrase/recombinase XerD
VTSGWIAVNPAKGIKSRGVKQAPTMPFSADQWRDILTALDMYGEIHKQSPETIRRQLRALMLLLRYSGLRICDAVALRTSAVDAKGRLFLYQAKTGEPVKLPLPDEVLNALRAIEEGGPYYFWNGTSTLKSRMTEWQERLKKVFVIAGIPDGHAHRFRDTFSVAMLDAGVSLETVSILLGHKSIKTTEKHYAPFVKSRQEALEAAVKGTW